MKKVYLFTALMLAGGLALTACDQSQEMSPSQTADLMEQSTLESKSYGGAADGYAQNDVASSPAPMPPPNQPGSDNPIAVSYLAYRYNYAFSLPVKSVAQTSKSHAQICMDAGPAKCQVLSSNTNVQSDDYINARLSLRAEPKWLETFKQDIITSVETAKGELTGSGVQADDLTRSILDTDARLKAKKVLRTRLENLLETRDAKLPDLMALERELARVQAEIESATTTLNVLRKRVSMSTVDINYQTKQVAISSSSVSPIGRSIKGFVGTFSYALSNVIDFIAAILPWLILIIPTLWFLRRWWRKRKTAKS